MYHSNIEDLATRVQRGLDWILTHGAEYDVDLSRVDVEEDALWMSNSTRCVLGQAAQSGPHADVMRYYDVVDKATEAAGIDSPHAWAIDHGFLIPDSGVDTWDDMADAWREAIREHRAAEVTGS
jgi:hypothetical protein